MIYAWQQSQWQQIDKLLASNRLPHAIFLQGNKGIGKKDFALAMAHAVLCQQPTSDRQACGSCSACKLLAANTHPDLYHLAPTPPQNSKSKNPMLNIRIDVVRDLCERLNQTSQYGVYRVAVIEQADELTLAAANSLLKTLEEPGQNVLIVLTSARAHRLPVTIRSRCQVMRFNVPDVSQSLSWLKQQPQQLQEKVSVNQLQQALHYAYGAPLIALENLQDQEYFEVLGEAMTAAISGKNSLEYALKLTKFPKTKILEGMQGWVSDLARLMQCDANCDIINQQYRSKLQTLANKVKQQRLFRFQEQLNFNISHSSIAVNEQLLWENLLLSWDNL